MYEKIGKEISDTKISIATLRAKVEIAQSINQEKVIKLDINKLEGKLEGLEVARSIMVQDLTLDTA